jgi:hypothetical protein
MPFFLINKELLQAPKSPQRPYKLYLQTTFLKHLERLPLRIFGRHLKFGILYLLVKEWEGGILHL